MKTDDSKNHNRPIVYTREDGVVVYRASSLGRCMKALVAARLGYESMAPPDNFKNRFRDGHLHEPDIMERVTSEYGIPVSDFQRVIELPVKQGVVIRGSIDGLGQHPTLGPCVVDAKALSQASYELWLSKQWDAWPTYAWQQSVYAYGLVDESEVKGRPLPIVMATKNKNTGAMEVMDFPEPPVSWSRIRAKVLKVEMLAAKGELPETCDRTDYPCPFFYLHEEKAPDVGCTVATEDAQIDELANQYIIAADMEKEAKAQKDEARVAILAALGERDEVKTATVAVTRAKKSRKSLDKKALVAAGIDLATYETETTYEELRVKAS